MLAINGQPISWSDTTQTRNPKLETRNLLNDIFDYAIHKIVEGHHRLICFTGHL